MIIFIFNKKLINLRKWLMIEVIIKFIIVKEEVKYGMLGKKYKERKLVC